MVAKKKTTKKVTKKKTTKKKATATKRKAKKKKAVKKKKAKGGSKRKPNAAFMKPLSPSATLAKIIGSKAIPRTEAVKLIWKYIKKKGLQDKKNRRMINTDDNLRDFFGKKQASMFDVAKALKKHLK